MIYPLYEINWDQPENRDLILRSLNCWQSNPAALQGYSFTGRASIYASMGEGDKARDALRVLLDKFVKPNTMYLESGPVIETPLAAATSIQELYLQYWNNTARIFPAIPTDWEEAAFENLRTEGAFLISAVRREGKTHWVKVRSTVAGELKIKPGLEGTVRLRSSAKGLRLKKEEAGTYICQMPSDAEIILYSSLETMKTSVGPAVHTQGNANSYGLK